MRNPQASGFTLVEVLVAVAILMVAWLAAARLFASSVTANAGARGITQATILAVEKMEQLRALPFDDARLAFSPADSLSIDVGGYFDTSDGQYVRRWSIDPLPSHPDSAIVIHVIVARSPAANEAHLVTIRTRRAG
jgi:prepilin-type N-terminal cleavage/methylation domain-containing protein